MINTFLGFILVLGSPIAYHNYRFDGALCFLTFIYGIYILTH